MFSKKMTPVGYKALVELYNLSVLPHSRWSYVTLQGSRRTEENQALTIYIYDKSYLPKQDTPCFHLEFALKYDGINLHILSAIFKHLSIEEVTCYVQETPTGKYTRMTWYLYEILTGKILPLPDCSRGTYELLLDPKRYYTSTPIASVRHRIKDNMLGNKFFCPMVKRTPLLQSYESKNFSKQINDVINAYDPVIVQRASNYLFTKETLSSYAIERERPNKQRQTRFIALLKKMPSHNEKLTKAMLIALQNTIVDARFTNHDYRTTQNYVGEERDFQYQFIHYIAPKPKDVPALMEGLLSSVERMLEAQIPQIIIAAVISFGFVFIHPFDDGNGRIHRFFIHYLLAKTDFTPTDTIFPVSATMLQNMKAYNDALESFSKPLLETLPSYTIDEKGILTISGTTNYFYQYVDYTTFAEYLYACVEQTIYGTFKEELSYLVRYDKTKKKLQDIVDMPDRFIDLLIKLVVQEEGSLSEKKASKYFSALSKQELAEMISIVRRYMLKL